jgi:hypothetical protein
VNAPPNGGSPQARIHFEFKIENLDHFRRQPVSMFSYDLVAGYKLVYGRPTVFAECQHHLDADRIPLLEATRLLFNRCSGLLLGAELLRHTSLDADQSDFVARNIAKARLAIGDAVLTAYGQYHWSCLERNRRLLDLECDAQAGTPTPLPLPLDEIRRHHTAGVEFKLHPARNPEITSAIQSCHSEVLELSRKAWLWLESRRLNRQFASVQDYAACPVRKLPETARWRNLLLNLRSFGLRGALDSMAYRYPRERLFNCLPVLLWNTVPNTAASDATLHLQRQLHTSASDWNGLVSAYKAIWPEYG